MASGLKFAAALLVGLIIGAMGMYALVSFTLSSPSTEMQAVANQISIVDVTTGVTFTLKYLGIQGSVLPALNEFPAGHTYQHSLWAFYAGNDIEAFLTVTGPGIDNRTYGAEVSRCCWDEIHVITPAGTFDMPSVAADGMPQTGYVSVQFIPTF